MVRPDGAVGLHLTTDIEEGWRRSVCPFTHSDLSRTRDDLKQDAEAEAIVLTLTHSLTHSNTIILSQTTISSPHKNINCFHCIYSCQVMSHLRLVWAHLSSRHVDDNSCLFGILQYASPLRGWNHWFFSNLRKIILGRYFSLLVLLLIKSVPIIVFVCEVIICFADLINWFVSFSIIYMVLI